MLFFVYFEYFAASGYHILSIYCQLRSDDSQS